MSAKKPNILVLWGDDVGWWNISYNSRGQMGYRTPNIDRVANEGVAFTDYYAQQSCTAGRAAFMTGQNPIRTGLTKVGMPGATNGLQAVVRRPRFPRRLHPGLHQLLPRARSRAAGEDAERSAGQPARSLRRYELRCETFVLIRLEHRSEQPI